MQYIDADEDALTIAWEGDTCRVPWDAVGHTLAPGDVPNPDELLLTIGKPPGPKTSITVPLRDDPHVQALFVAAGKHGKHTRRTMANIRAAAHDRGHAWHLGRDGSPPGPLRPAPAPPNPPDADAGAAAILPAGFGTPRPALTALPEE